MIFDAHEWLFCPLGGSNEIGLNANLYHYQGKWLMVDLGAGFADAYYPGVSMIAPDLEFIEERKEDLLGIVLTHAHEDHLGAVGYLWDELRCPIYATPFTAALVIDKLEQAGFGKEAKVTIIDPEETLKLGPFTLDFVELTHSTPEMQAVIVRTELGNVVHTGDWKFDPRPVIGDESDLKALKKIGDDGVLAMVCDSTNVFEEKFAGSESDLVENLKEVVAAQKGLVVVTTFASNVGRIDTIARAAQAAGRKVVLSGRSLHRIDGIARSTGYLEDLEPFMDDTAFHNIKRSELLVIATGCQGEPNAAMSKIVEGRHRHIKLTPKDTVIFSSRRIPGNEKRLFRLMNLLARKDINVVTDKEHRIHVSGHPSREELKQMYDLVRPEVAIPVHGEPVHLKEHVKFALEQGVKQAFEIQNGEVIKLAPGKPESKCHVHSGYFAVDGYALQPPKGEVMRFRRKIQGEGVVFVSLVLNKKWQLASKVQVEAPGVIDSDTQADILLELQEELQDQLSRLRLNNAEKVRKTVHKIVKNAIKHTMGKYPLIRIQTHQI